MDIALNDATRVRIRELVYGELAPTTGEARARKHLKRWLDSGAEEDLSAAAAEISLLSKGRINEIKQRLRI